MGSFRRLAEDVLLLWPAADGGSAEADSAGAGKFLDAVRPNELLERRDFLGVADDFEHDCVRPQVRHPGPEDLGERHQLASAAGGSVHLDESELTLYGLARFERADAKNVDKLVHLLLELLERLARAVDAKRDPGDVRPLRRAYGQALDVVAAPGEHVRDSRERARLVLDKK